MKLNNYSIKTVYLVSVVVISVIVGLTIFSLEVFLSTREIRKEIEFSLRQKISEYQGIMNDLVRQNDQEQIRRIISSLSSDKNFEAAWLSDEKGIIFAADKRKLLGLDQKIYLEQLDIGKQHGHSMDHAECLYLEGYHAAACLPISLGASKGFIAPNIEGDFWMVYDIESVIDTNIRMKLGLSLFISFLVFSFFLGFFLFLYKSAFSRLLEIIKAVWRFGIGERDLKFQVEGKDEIALLGQTLDDMAMLVAKNERDIANYVKTIDENVIISRTNANGVITYASDAFCRISGYTKEEMIGKSHNLVRHPDMPDELFSNLWNTIKSGKVWSGEIKNQKKDGGYYWVSATITPAFDRSGNIVEYTAVRQDITAEKKMAELAVTDELTGLFNRRYFNDIFQYEINRSAREGLPFCFIIFDVDYFKQYNDTYGHLEGDRVLKLIGQTLNNIFKRAGDYAFRLGGEEFGVIAKVGSLEDCTKVCDLIMAEIAKLNIEHKNNPVMDRLTVSTGAVFIESIGPNLTLNEIYRLADNYLYESKTKGRNRTTLVNI